jgi:glycosyltransferase involved in cell wall biosynthesis
MKVVILEPFFIGSHQSWAEGLQQHSHHEVTIISLQGRHWKWRMHGGAISLANQYLQLKFRPDVIVASDMLDFSTFLALTKSSTHGIPTAVYFHENQLSYPWSPTDEDVQKGRDFHYGFINWTSILAADKVFFNSAYNQNSFFKELAILLGNMPDYKELQLIPLAQANSQVLPLGIQLSDLYINVIEKDYSVPIILWNHRWEYDKNPEDFHQALQFLKSQSIQFKLIVCGEGFQDQPKVFEQIKSEFAGEIIHFGFAESKEAYHALLRQANILPVTSKQEFFGQSVIEAIAAGCYPLLPNSLAYPEHIPESLKNLFLYQDIAQLHTNLADLCTNFGMIQNLVAPLQEYIMRYDWKNCIQQYDAQLESLANSKG